MCMENIKNKSRKNLGVNTHKSDYEVEENKI